MVHKWYNLTNRGVSTLEREKRNWEITIITEDQRKPIYWQINPKFLKWGLGIGISVMLSICVATFVLVMIITKQSDEIAYYESVIKAQEVLIEDLELDKEQLKQTISEKENEMAKRIEQEKMMTYQGGPTKEASTINVTELFATPPPMEEDNPYEPTYTPCEGVITSYYGYRKNPFNKSEGDNHSGMDIAASYGTPIYAAAAGRVSEARYMNGYGYAIFIEHGEGVETRYAHASKLYVKEGQEVKKGEKIAAVGSSGNSTGPHLHFELRRDGKTTDPKNLFEKE